MNTLAAQEIKRRGVKAIELALKQGPVHIIKNNTPTCVVLTEAEYIRLTSGFQHKKKDYSLLQWLLQKKSSGSKSREELDTYLTAERDDWDR